MNRLNEKSKVFVIAWLWAMAVVFAIIGTMSLISSAQAAAIDELNNRSDYDYCGVAADMFAGGAVSHAEGFARKISELTSADLDFLEHGGHLDKTQGMKVQDWDSMDPRDREFMSLNVLEGYDFSAENGPINTEEKADLARQGKFEQCMQFRTAKKSAETESQRNLHKQSYNFSKIASSQALADPRITDARFCDHMMELIVNVAVYKTQGMSEADLYAAFPVPENWSLSFTAYVKETVSALYASGDESKFVDDFVASCVAK